MANTRENVEKAVAGDIIGLYDTGNFQIGDSIYTGKEDIKFAKLPQFTPELFVRVSACLLYTSLATVKAKYNQV